MAVRIVVAVGLVAVAACGDPEARKEIAALRAECAKREETPAHKAVPPPPVAEVKLTPADAKAAPETFDAAEALRAAVRHDALLIHRAAAWDLSEFLDEHGEVKDTKVLAERLREQSVKQLGKRAYTGLANSLGPRLGSAIWYGRVQSVKGPSPPPDADRPEHLTRMAAIALGSFGELSFAYKLTAEEMLDEQGHLRDPAPFCRRARQAHGKSASGHQTLVHTYGTVVGTEIWNGWLCPDEAK